MIATMPTGGWTWLDNAAIDRIPEVGPRAFAVLAVLARHADAKRESYPGVARIAQLTAMSERQVKREIATLCDAGLVSRQRRSRGRGLGTFNVYRILPALHRATPDPMNGVTRGQGRPDASYIGPGEAVTSGQERSLHGATGGPETRLIEQDKKNKKPPKSPKGDLVGFPAELAGEDFSDAWREWEAYRAQRKNKLTDIGRRRQLKKLAALGAARAIAAIDHSITQGYTGIFEPSRVAAAGPAELDTDFTLTGES